MSVRPPQPRAREFPEPDQRGPVQAPSGDRFLFTHHGDGSREGRPAGLIPVTWKDGWPVIGKVDPDGLGTMVRNARKPVQDGPLRVPQNDDGFSGPRLGMQWEWNYRPRSGWALDGLCRFSYGTDGESFAQLGAPRQFGWTDYRGERIGLFSYNNTGEAGHADFGSFTYRYDSAATR